MAPNNEGSAETCSGEAHHGEMDRTNHDIRDVRRFRTGRDCRVGGCILSGHQLAGYKAVHAWGEAASNAWVRPRFEQKSPAGSGVFGLPLPYAVAASSCSRMDVSTLQSFASERSTTKGSEAPKSWDMAPSHGSRSPLSVDRSPQCTHHSNDPDP